MATKSEDIRLQMNNVKFKKGDGTLYLMGERLAWMPNTKNNFALSHKYSDIKMQKISPEGKAKIQLQIVLQTGDNTTFQFANLEDRTAVKDALLQILPQFKGKMPKDRERKALILSKSPHLLQLYKDLVETKIISVDEFWSQFANDIDVGDSQTEQEVGVSANFMSGIPLNGKQVKGTVSAETLFAILKTYPKVAKMHQEMVPTKMTETEFWNKFFQSRYFNRDRTKDMFSDCAKSDEKEWKQGVIEDPFLDVDLFDDNAYRNTAGEAPPDNHDQSLIKRFNQQSIRLIDSLSQARPGGGGGGGGGGRVTSRKEGLSVDLYGPDEQNMEEDFRANTQHWPREMYSFLPQTMAMDSNLVQDHFEALKSWEPRPTSCLSSKDATEALKNLSPSGILMRSTDQNQLSDTVPEELQARLKSAYFASNELLRHFWLCFPALEPSMEAKLCKLYETIKKFETTKIQPLNDSLPRDHRHLLNHLMRRQFKEASNKFEDWKNKKRARELVSARKQ